MALCRYLPTPSERMGAIWTLLSVKEAVVLEYGPAGTTHYSVSLFSSMNVSPNQNLFTTHMSEDDVIMGDVSRLEDALEEIDKNYAPKVIFVVASSVSSVIGTDIKGVCRYMQQQVNAKLIPVETGGFKGDYTVGLREAYHLFAEHLIGKTGDTVPKSYNILGASPHAYRIQSDLNEIQSLMQEAFGYGLHSVLGMDNSVSGLEALGNAEINLVLRTEALPVAQQMQEKYGIPYVYVAPYGYQGTEDWLKEIAEKIGGSPSDKMTETLRERRDTAIHFKMYARMYQSKTTLPHAAVMADYDTLQGFIQIFREILIQPTLCACPHSLQNIESPDASIVVFENERMQIDTFKKLNHHIVLADEISLHLCNDTNTTLCVSFPLVHHGQIAQHLPLMGIRGMDYILESVDAYYRKLV